MKKLMALFIIAASASLLYADNNPNYNNANANNSNYSGNANSGGCGGQQGSNYPQGQYQQDQSGQYRLPFMQNQGQYGQTQGYSQNQGFNNQNNQPGFFQNLYRQNYNQPNQYGQTQGTQGQPYQQNYNS